MKSIKVLAVLVSAIAVFPAASWADNVSGTTQETNLSSTTIGNGNLSVTQSKQIILDAQKAGYSATNASGTEQKITGSNVTVGNGNVNVNEVLQEALKGQTSK